MRSLDAVLATDGVRAVSRQVSLGSEHLPLTLAERVAQLRDAQSVVLPREGGLRVLTVVASRLAPIERPAATSMIAAFLHNERKMTLVREGIATCAAALRRRWQAFGSNEPRRSLAEVTRRASPDRDHASLS